MRGTCLLTVLSISTSFMSIRLRRHGPYVTWIVTVVAVASDLLLEPPTLTQPFISPSLCSVLRPRSAGLGNKLESISLPQRSCIDRLPLRLEHLLLNLGVVLSLASMLAIAR